jgi:hypothetical protein
VVCPVHRRGSAVANDVVDDVILEAIIGHEHALRLGSGGVLHRASARAGRSLTLVSSKHSRGSSPPSEQLAPSGGVIEGYLTTSVLGRVVAAIMFWRAVLRWKSCVRVGANGVRHGARTRQSQPLPGRR